MSKTGIALLKNQAVRRGPFAVVGIGDRFSGHDDAFSSLAAARSVIVRIHSPDVVLDLPASLLLVLAGDTHCGQVVLPGIGPLVMRAPKKDHWRQLYPPRYRCGIVRKVSSSVDWQARMAFRIRRPPNGNTVSPTPSSP